jgi:hypothetical protein
MDASKAVLLRSASMSDTDENEGAALDKLLRAHGHTVADLARGADRTWPAAKEWIKAAKLGPEARASAIRGLNALGIDPRMMWPDAESESLAELKNMLDDMDVSGLEKVRRALLAKRGDQVRLVDYIEGVIRHSKKGRK